MDHLTLTSAQEEIKVVHRVQPVRHSSGEQGQVSHAHHLLQVAQLQLQVVLLLLQGILLQVKVVLLQLLIFLLQLLLVQQRPHQVRQRHL